MVIDNGPSRGPPPPRAQKIGTDGIQNQVQVPLEYLQGLEKDRLRLQELESIIKPCMNSVRSYFANGTSALWFLRKYRSQLSAAAKRVIELYGRDDEEAQAVHAVRKANRG